MGSININDLDARLRRVERLAALVAAGLLGADGVSPSWARQQAQEHARVILAESVSRPPLETRGGAA